MFDSPFEFCRRCRGYVLLDQTQRECAREHRCAEGSACPLRRYFTGIDFAAQPQGTREPARRKRGGAPAPGGGAARRPKT